MMDFKKKAEELRKFVCACHEGECPRLKEVEKVIKQIWNEAIEESAKRAGDFDEDWIGDKIRDLEEK